MLEVHVGGTANAWRAVVPRMRSRRRGAICAIGSELGIIGDPSAPHYAAAKGAIHAMTKSLAVELGARRHPRQLRRPRPDRHAAAGPTTRTWPAYTEALPLGRVLAPRRRSPRPSRSSCCEDTNLVGQVISPNAGAVL